MKTVPTPVAGSAGLARLALLGICAGLAACGTVDQATRSFAGRLTPYQVEVVQGNFVSREQAALLQPGMTRLQVRDLLGSPLVSSVFHADRWDYVFTLKRSGQAVQSRRLSVFFKGDALVRHEADELPSETEFAAQFAARTKVGKIPPLEASEDSLKSFAARFPVDASAAGAASGASGGASGAAPASGAAGATAPARTSYPPLESGR
ncbi:MAG: outer membrane protein assembly factor BamE [Burkholderiaceae bacterium]